MTNLGKNRVYDIGQIQTLKDTAVSLLATGIDSCMSWDNSISELRSLISQAPEISPQLSSALERVSGKLYQSDYEVEKCWVEGALNNIITNIPSKDMGGAATLEPLTENLQLVTGMIEDLAGCIALAGSSLSLEDFNERLEGVKQDWEDTTLEENMEEFETSLLGILENTCYSDNPLTSYLSNKAESSLVSGIQFFPNAAFTGTLNKNDMNAMIAKFLEDTKIESDSSTEVVNDMVPETDTDLENILLIPEPGETITVSRGIELPDQTAVVFSWHAWSRLYSIEGCNSEYPNELCCSRLNYAVENYKCNSTDNDLLMFELEGYDEPVFAGAMVEGYADIGDIVEVTLDDDTDFHFLILDVKYTQHTVDELAENNQCQNEWGHGYMLGEDTVQLNVCEFITAGNYEVKSAQDAESGAFLKKRRVVEAQIVDHIQICEE